MSLISDFFSPTPRSHTNHGFEPNLYFKLMRFISQIIIKIFGLNRNNRFSNEFIQQLDPICPTNTLNGEELFFRTGHGRLYWRAQTLLDEEPLMIEWLESMKKNDVFFDIGANVGSYSIYAAKRGIETYSFEADLNNISLLYENIFLNQTNKKCTPIPIAIGEQNKMDTYFLRGTERSGDALNSLGRPNYMLGDNKKAQQYPINSIVATLDSIIEWFGLPYPSHLKVDVDGNELQVIEGAINALKFCQSVYIELDNNLEEHIKVMDILANNNFKVASKLKAYIPNLDVDNYLFVRQ